MSDSMEGNPEIIKNKDGVWILYLGVLSVNIDQFFEKEFGITLTNLLKNYTEEARPDE